MNDKPDGLRYASPEDRAAIEQVTAILKRQFGMDVGVIVGVVPVPDAKQGVTFNMIPIGSENDSKVDRQIRNLLASKIVELVLNPWVEHAASIQGLFRDEFRKHREN